MDAGSCLWGCGVSFYDFNKDGLDDLSFASYDEGVRLFRNDGDNFTELESIPIEGESQANFMGRLRQ